MRALLAALRRRPRLARDEGGAGAVEFALVVPLLLVLYIGGVDATLAINADKRLDNCATTIGDLVAQVPEITRSEISKIFDVRHSILQSFDDRQFGVTVTVVNVDEEGKATVAWSQSQNAASRPKGETVVLPGDLAKTKEAMIVITDVTYAHATLASGYGLPGPIELESTSYTRSRSRRPLDCADCT